MIKKIKNIKNFGIFKDFDWDKSTGIEDFKEKNIIYGWNYSGKTTLSRIFSSLKNKALHNKYEGGEFKVIFDEDKKETTQTNLDQFPYAIQVFNSEYIKENLKWDTTENLDAISFDVGENVKIREEIELNQKRVDEIRGTDKIKGKIQQYQLAIDEYDEFENFKYTNEAKRIKIDLFNSLIEFNKGHLKSVKALTETDPASHIISDVTVLAATKKMALANNDKLKIDDIIFTPTIKDIFDKVSKILISEPPKSEVIALLESDNNLYKWAKEGYDLHKPSNKEECSFCGNKISAERYTLLNNYFSNASAVLREEIETCKELIARESKELSEINIPKSKNDLTDKCQEDYENQLNKFTGIKDKYNEFLKKLNEELERKENGNIFIPLTIVAFEDLVKTDMETWISEIKKIIKTHNDSIENFETQQITARDEFKKHLVADFLTRENYKEKDANKIYSERYIRRYTCLVKKIEKVNDELLSKLKSVIAGQKELNDFIKAFLNREDITIEVTADDKFLLKRGVKYAENLSEGEKTAISFSYFLVTLESLHREKKLINTIIFIDDPISSLDANHIAQVYSLINSFFFRKGEDPANPEAAINCFKQLFISTHNFEFFSFLKDSPQLNRRNKNIPTTGCQYYFIKRVAADNSQIIQLPKSLRLKSEYVYLFEILFKFHKDGCKMEDDSLILMPNALRRFFEVYTLEAISKMFCHN